MPKTRVSVKSRRYGKKKGWPSKTRSFPWRTGTKRPAETTTGMRSGVPKAASVHRFTRWGNAMTINEFDNGGALGIKVESDGGGQIPLDVTPIPSAQVGQILAYGWGGAFQWQLKDLPSYNDFTTLFDQYEIEQVDVEISLGGNVAIVGANTQLMPSMLYVPDFDDNLPPMNGSAVEEYQRAKSFEFNPGQTLKVSVKPRVTVPVYRSNGLFGQHCGQAGAKIDCAVDDVPTYGLKFWMRNCLMDKDAPKFTLQVRCKYHLKFLDPK